MKQENRISGTIAAGIIALALGANHAAAQVKTRTIQIDTNCTANVITITVTNNSSDIAEALSSTEIQTIVQAFSGSNGMVTTFSTNLTFGTNMHSSIRIIKGGGGTHGSPNVVIKSGSCSKDPGAALEKTIQQLVTKLQGNKHLNIALSAQAEAYTGPVTWLGIAAEPASEDLHAQLSLPAGAGLIVRNVAKDSPAEKAGVQNHDILVKIDDQLMANEDQFKKLVRSRKEGEEISLTLLRKGKEIIQQVRLIKKDLALDERAGAHIIDLGSFNLDLGKIIGQLGTNIQPIVINKVFSANGNTNIQKEIDDAIRQAIDQINRQLPVHGDRKSVV